MLDGWLQWFIGDVPLLHIVLEGIMVVLLVVLYLGKSRKVTKKELTPKVG